MPRMNTQKSIKEAFMLPCFSRSSAALSFSQSSAAFSLIELLVVVAIITILFVLVVPAMRSISTGTHITGASEELAGLINQARQRASTFNRQVAIRFFREGDASTPFDRYQLWEQKESSDPNSWTSIERMRRLPMGIVVTNSSTFSPVLELSEYQGTTNSMSYSEILFLPSGSLVAQTNTFITLVSRTGSSSGGIVSGLPPNFATIVIEPMNARPAIYRP